MSPSGLKSEVGQHGITLTGETTGIEGVDADAAEGKVQYYNLQGVRVANPENGLYIRRQGSKVEKVLLK